MIGLNLPFGPFTFGSKGSSPRGRAGESPSLPSSILPALERDNTCYPSPGREGLSLARNPAFRPVPSSRIPLTECKGSPNGGSRGLAGGGPGIGHRLGEKEGRCPSELQACAALGALRRATALLLRSDRSLALQPTSTLFMVSKGEG